MIYCYPKLSNLDLLFCRLGGPGLGNLLFPWARAKVLALQYKYQFISPTWPQLKLGPLIRGELDNRSYFSLFKNLSEDLSGFDKAKVLLLNKKIPEHEHQMSKKGDVIVTSGMGNLFNDILNYPDYLHGELVSMLFRDRMEGLMLSLKTSDSIAVHVRFGDFKVNNMKTGKQVLANIRQPIEWYVLAVMTLRRVFGDNTPVNVFSDASEEELTPLLDLVDVHLVKENTAIEDILLIARHKVLVASGSTFSMWSSFLGQIPTVWYPGQMKYRLLRNELNEVEFNSSGMLPTTFFDKCL